MTLDEFVLRNKSIGERLDLIANRTANMAWLGIANSSNPAFVELMKAQQHLLDAADRLLSLFEKSGTT